VTMDNAPEQNLVFKVRFEYEIPVKTGRLFGKRKDFKQEAEAIREKKINILEKVPVKGIRILEIDPHHEIYIKMKRAGRLPVPLLRSFLRQKLWRMPFHFCCLRISAE